MAVDTVAAIATTAAAAAAAAVEDTIQDTAMKRNISLNISDLIAKTLGAYVQASVVDVQESKCKFTVQPLDNSATRTLSTDRNHN
eukprot:8423384-Ditylum_brightwellii.AAC.1